LCREGVSPDASGRHHAVVPDAAPRDDDFDVLFGDDYLYFYQSYPGAEETAVEIELISDLLQLPRGARVLDLACGYGRITNPLAARGLAMTGLDRSAPLLAHAAAEAGERGLRVDWVRADMRELAFAAQFDAVLSWFTSFGYFPDDQLHDILRSVHRALRPGGTFLLENLNRDQLLRDFQNFFVLERNGDFLIDENRFDTVTGRSYHHRTTIRDGEMRTGEWTLRQFTFPEIRDWLLRAGFETVDAFGEDTAVFSTDSNRMIALARKHR